MYNAREAAFEILCKMESDGAYSNVALSACLQAAKPARREAQLTAALVYGVTERRLTLDWNLALYLSQPLKKLKPQVLTLLRIGAYQLLYMDKIPASAAVNEAVKCAKQHGCAYAAGLLNAVLRKLSVNGLQLPETADKLADQSIRYSYPQWLVRHFTDAYGAENAVRIMSASSGRGSLFVRVNTLRTDAATLCGLLAAEGVTATPTESLPDCLLLGTTGDLTQLPSFQKGLFHVQDISSQHCCRVLDAREGEFVVDACAAPGGKAFTSAYRMRDNGRILACDIHPFKADRIADGARRLGLRCIETVCADANTLAASVHDADRVLCDAPCSGLGVTGRKPEIRYKAPEETAALPPIQRTLLQSCARMVKPGGVLVYSTCTLNPAENEAVCDAFLEQNPAFSADDTFVPAQSPTKRYQTVLPDGQGDGFFIARFLRAR